MLAGGLNPRQFNYKNFMALTKLWIHCVWSTKLRIPFLNSTIRNVLLDHIIKNSENRSIEIAQIGGWYDHIHVLIKIHPSQNLSSIIHLIKGESSSWINKGEYCPARFEWQEAYYAESISTKDIKFVKNYIRNQEEHHSKRTYFDEMKLMKKNKFFR